MTDKRRDELSQVSAAARTLPAPPSGKARGQNFGNWLFSLFSLSRSRRRCWTFASLLRGQITRGHAAFLNERYQWEHARDGRKRTWRGSFTDETPAVGHLLTQRNNKQTNKPKKKYALPSEMSNSRSSSRGRSCAWRQRLWGRNLKIYLRNNNNDELCWGR